LVDWMTVKIVFFVLQPLPIFPIPYDSFVVVRFQFLAPSVKSETEDGRPYFMRWKAPQASTLEPFGHAVLRKCHNKD
jgi:hypothetical protein